MPESPRWLLTKRRPEEASKILQKMAKVNGKFVSDDYLNDFCKTNEVSSYTLHTIVTLKTGRYQGLPATQSRKMSAFLWGIKVNRLCAGYLHVYYFIPNVAFSYQERT